MSDSIQVGSIITGKVTGIQPYGAFVALDENIQGLVHISEITHGYVKEIKDHIKVGEQVTVKVLTIDKEAGKIGLSIRATEEPPANHGDSLKLKKAKKRSAIIPLQNDGELSEGFNTLKEKLHEWIAESQNQDLIKK
jgi:general stress protein 13